ncbi:YfgM family protein [Roseiconus lacunae]|uniref:Tetratricopeptide repeat protein n=1 Tax=Roseiconus lacunae TaxID=2605694 RepID=A0ABT7PD78_9BACT|nr:tetratricopeptide repeat protein [Roseiconus lacunae]MDM4014460.1 tetratricopeptide repeat protein [Roseiconus lacunae]WRQ49775.1 tetratricopeptide repeat protein [Stieleria sp. HD01]
MNTRQEELETNIVADQLAIFYKKIEPYSKLIAAAVVAVVVAMLAYGFYSSSQTATRSDATFQLLMNNPEVASRYPDTTAAAWSQLFQANQNLAQGISSLYRDKAEAETLLAQAKDEFINARVSSDDEILISRANYGLALAHEALGEVDDAMKAYEAVVSANESEEMVEVAEQRIATLKSSTAGTFLTWFNEQDFAPADPSLPPELPGSTTLPDLPDLELPDLDLDSELSSEFDALRGEASDAEMTGGIELPEEPTAEEKGDAESTPAETSSTEPSETTPEDDASSEAAPPAESE